MAAGEGGGSRPGRAAELEREAAAAAAGGEGGGRAAAGGRRRRRLYMGIGYRLQIQFITRKHRSGGGRVTPARRRRAEASGPGARPARVGGLRPPLGVGGPRLAAGVGVPCRRLPAPSFLPPGPPPPPIASRRRRRRRRGACC